MLLAVLCMHRKHSERHLCMQANGLAVLQHIMDLGQDNVVTQRAMFILDWLGMAADEEDFEGKQADEQSFDGRQLTTPHAEVPDLSCAVSGFRPLSA